MADALNPAKTQARSGLERAGAARTGFFLPNVILSIDGTVHSKAILHDSLRITLTLNDDPDTASFTLTLSAGVIPLVGQQITLSLGSLTNPMFAGQILRVTIRRRPGHWDETPFIDVVCMDWTRNFDARLVTYEWRATSGTAVVADLLARWVPAGFTMKRVVAGLPTVDLAIVNERPSTVLRRVATQIGDGRFYIDATRDIHLWQGATETGLSNPQSLTNDRKTLMAFTETSDCSQVRTRMIVEGRRTDMPLGLPAQAAGVLSYVPIADPSVFSFPGANTYRDIRIGTQRFLAKAPPVLVDPMLNAKGTQVTTAYDPGTATPGSRFVIVADASVLIVTSGSHGIMKAGDQYLHFNKPGAPNSLQLSEPTLFGGVNAPLGVGTQVTSYPFFDSILAYTPDWVGTSSEPLRAQAAGQDVVLFVRANDTAQQSAWAAREGSDGIYEHLVQDGRFSFAGATTRATAELAQFSQALTTAEWVTEDMNALPGRTQAIAFAGVAPLNLSLLIDTVVLSVPVANRPPRRQCSGSTVKLSTFGDVVVTDLA